MRLQEAIDDNYIRTWLFPRQTLIFIWVMHRPQTQTWQCGRMTRPLVVPEVPEWRGRGGCVGVRSQQGVRGSPATLAALDFLRYSTQRVAAFKWNCSKYSITNERFIFIENIFCSTGPGWLSLLDSLWTFCYLLTYSVKSLNHFIMKMIIGCSVLF